ncbi:hypothetical protein MKX03_033453 [Papaver bracteatum]|nr:hypothetical protein MKX03_033453 [Papaver bracteatum]
MSISLQYKSVFRHPRNPHKCCPQQFTARIQCVATARQSRNRDQQVVAVDELQLLSSTPPLVIPTMTQKKPMLDDPDLQSTWTHRAWVASGSISIIISLLKSANSVAVDPNLSLEPVFAGLIGYLLADLGSGVYHWAIDNYGDATTPLVGAQIEAFQGHHRFPWTITRREFANNLHALARVITFTVLPIGLVSNEPVFNAFVGMFGGCIMFSQQFHAWAHGTKSKLPSVVLALQDSGVLVSRAEHGAHHHAPYNNNYCIVSGAWNKILDENNVFEALEMILYFRLGVRPRSWSEPNSDWTEETLPLGQ